MDPAGPPPPKTVTVPSGTAYVCVRLEFKISGNIGHRADRHSRRSRSVNVAIPSAIPSIGNAAQRIRCMMRWRSVFKLRTAAAPTDSDEPGSGRLPAPRLQCLPAGGPGCQHRIQQGPLRRTIAGLHPGRGRGGEARYFLHSSLQADASLSFRFAYTGSFEALSGKTTPRPATCTCTAPRCRISLTLHAGVSLTPDPGTSTANMTSQFGSLMGKFLPG